MINYVDQLGTSTPSKYIGTYSDNNSHLSTLFSILAFHEFHHTVLPISDEERSIDLNEYSFSDGPNTIGNQVQLFLNESQIIKKRSTR